MTDQCGPFVCEFPRPEDHEAGDRWRCPECDTVYVLSRPRRVRWWRNWYAPHGVWRIG